MLFSTKLLLVSKYLIKAFDLKGLFFRFDIIKKNILRSLLHLVKIEDIDINTYVFFSKIINNFKNFKNKFIFIIIFFKIYNQIH